MSSSTTSIREVPNTFKLYALSSKETLLGSVLTELQTQVLHNLRTVVAEEKLYLEYDIANPTEFIQQEAYKRGQLDLISHILDLSKAAQEELNNPNGKNIEIED